MIYLVGENVFSFNSGTEFSQFERLKAFNEQGFKTKLLLRNYSRMLAKDMEKHGIAKENVINMYDYFQETVALERTEKPLRLLDSMALKDYHIVGIDNNISELRYQGKVIGKVHVMPETIGLVGVIEYFDSLGHTTLKEHWDWRGFRSMVETYHPNGEIATQEYLKQDGTIALEVVHMQIGDKVLPSSWKLPNYKGQTYVFDTQDQLFTFFLNEVNASEPGIFISDRRTLDNSVANVINAKQKLAFIHSAPFVDNKNVQAGIVPSYRDVLTNQKFDQVLFPTKQAADQVKEFLPNGVAPGFAPDSWVTPVKEAKQLTAQKTLVYVGRLAEEKNIGDLLKTFKYLHDQDKTLRLKLQGYFSSQAYRERLQKLVAELKIKDVVTFMNYDLDLSIYAKATLFVNTSDSEGLGMNMLESMAHAVPVISYAVPYTKDDLIKDGENGFNVKNKTPKILANKIADVLSSPTEYQKLSNGALMTAKKHSKKAFIDAWQQVLSF
ncbi:glycosyltransferase [Ligilactobacillus apodemi]|uniref:Glycosyl transferase group 1 n=1 Tax=Ligilactobacillus apodemi DSM 16634 = JCM 16172 TaxID=1423724 RepID=A0A0R1TTD7_9LACO|nr:glycosyltransferase [Ligilactobacillus apodemi]KRL84541.1 glycosyl transferase group 1 [Ligilactobacillus apodemi DSM 16634 = JCM 16172]